MNISKLEELTDLIRDGLSFIKPSPDDGEYQIKIYEDTLVAKGFTREQIESGMRRLENDGIIKVKQTFYAPNVTLSTHHPERATGEPKSAIEGKTMPDETFNRPVYYLYIDKAFAEALPKFSSAEFKDDEAALYLGTTRIQLPPNRGEHVFCRVMFKHPINIPVSWDEIYEEISGEKDFDKSGKRKIYDLARSVSKKIQEITKMADTFVWQGQTVKRIR